MPFDGLAIARALAAELKDGGFDLILFGRMATDTASGTVGPMTAELLDLPCVTSISHLEIADRKGTARRDLEGATETVTFPLPAVLTIDEGIARPRLASLKGIMAAKKKPLEVKPAQLGEARLEIESISLPPDRAPGPHRGRGRRRGARAGPAAPRRSEGALMADHVLAFAESRGGDLRKVAFEAVTAARKAADASGGGEVHALLIGAPGIAARAADLGRYGADLVVVGGARGARAVQPRGLRRDGRRAHQVRRLSRGVLPRVGRGSRPRPAGRGEARRRSRRRT